ncbi:MAG: hypothetical protein ACI8S6_004689 [Myxococcota bacterium]|jgi:hypothetical protein
MGQLKIQERLDGVEIRFPGNGLPASSTAGKLFQTAFWVCCFSPILFTSGDNGIWPFIILPALAVLAWLGLRARRLRLELSEGILRLSSSTTRRALPLEEITAVAQVKDQNMGMYYVTIEHGGETVTVDALLKEGDARSLVERIEAAVARRTAQLLADDAMEAARPPEALTRLLESAHKPGRGG